MRTTAKELKKWLENINDDSLISINTYKNNREKNVIVATQFHDDGKVEEKEFTVSMMEKSKKRNLRFQLKTMDFL